MTTNTPGNARKAITPISPIESIREQLLKLKPKPTHGKEQAFAGLYADIQHLMAEKVTQRDILAVLASHGVKLSPARFKELLRKHSGEPVSNASRTQSAPRNGMTAPKAPSQGARVIQSAYLTASGASVAGPILDKQAEDLA